MSFRKTPVKKDVTDGQGSPLYVDKRIKGTAFAESVTGLEIIGGKLVRIAPMPVNPVRLRKVGGR